MTSEFDLSLRDLQKSYIKAQKKVWRIQKRMVKSRWSRTYDPYGWYKAEQKLLTSWKRWGIDVAAELKRRDVWLIDPGLHNRVNID